MAQLLTGKRGLIIGIANERSIAWGIARSLYDEGAELAVTYQNDAMGKRVIPLAEKIDAKIVEKADVMSCQSLDALFQKISVEWGILDFLVHSIAYSDRNELTGRFIATTHNNFLNSLSISCYSLIELARRAHPYLSNNSTILTLTYQGSNRVMPCYNVMGIAKAALEASVRYLANDLGPEGIRVNAISPGPMKTLAGAAIGAARKTFRHSGANSPLRVNPTLDAIGGTAVYLVSDYGKHTTGEIVRVDGGYHILGMPQQDNL